MHAREPGAQGEMGMPAQGEPPVPRVFLPPGEMGVPAQREPPVPRVFCHGVLSGPGDARPRG